MIQSSFVGWFGVLSAKLDRRFSSPLPHHLFPFLPLSFLLPSLLPSIFLCFFLRISYLHSSWPPVFIGIYSTNFYYPLPSVFPSLPCISSSLLHSPTFLSLLLPLTFLQLFSPTFLLHIYSQVFLIPHLCIPLSFVPPFFFFTFPSQSLASLGIKLTPTPRRHIR